MAKRTLEDVERALAWRHLTYNKDNPRSRRRSSIIGSARFKVYGFSSQLSKVVLYGDTVTQFKHRSEVESAVWSQIASQPVAGRLLKKGK